MFAFRVSDVFAPRRILHWRRLLWQSQYWPQERWQALQEKWLGQMLDYCFDHVPYYQRTFAALGLKRSDIRSLADLSRLPVLSKETLRQTPEEFKPRDFARIRAVPHWTSGTTGSPLLVHWDTAVNVVELVSQWRHFAWFGYRLGDPFLDIRNFKFHLQEATHRWNWKCRGLEFSARDIDDATASRFADLLRHFRVKFWRGHSAALHHLAQKLEGAGRDDVKPRFIVTVAEMLWPMQREFLERWSGAPVAINYGLNERNALLCECPLGGIHVAVEYGHVDIVKDDGTPAAAGEEGRIIATGFHNRATPLLRYDTGDYAVASARRCGCGRTLPLVERLTGRTNDKLWDARGRWFAGLHHVVKYGRGIRRSQIVQRQPGVVDYFVVGGDGFTPEAERHLGQILQQEMGEHMILRLHRVEALPFEDDKKFRFVVSLVQYPPCS